MTDPKLDLPVISTHVIYTLKHTHETRSFGLNKTTMAYILQVFIYRKCRYQNI